MIKPFLFTADSKVTEFYSRPEKTSIMKNHRKKNSIYPLRKENFELIG
jgi:hypothetical protein